jgi:hypothetical protein
LMTLGHDGLTINVKRGLIEGLIDSLNLPLARRNCA